MRDGGDASTFGPVILDCEDEISTRIAPASGSPALRILGIYESNSDHSVVGEATVTLDRSECTVLVLSSYEATHWTVNVGPGATLERVILNGYKQQTATVPAGVPIEDHSPYYHQWLGSCGYAWPDNGQGCNTTNLIAAAEQLTGLCLASFQGCDHATEFSFPATSGGTCTATSTSTTSSTSTASSSTTSTTLPCTSARCRFDASLHSPDCAGDTIPSSITKKLDKAVQLSDLADSAPLKKAKRLLKHAKRILKRAANLADKATKGNHPKLSSRCADSIRRAADGVREGLGMVVPLDDHRPTQKCRVQRSCLFPTL